MLVMPSVLSLVLAAGTVSANQAEGVRGPIVIDKGVLFLKARIDDSQPVLFVFDPGGGSYLTQYGARQSTGRKMLHIGAISIAAPTQVLEGYPSQLDPRHDRSQGEIAGTIGAELMHRFVLRIDYARQEITFINPAAFEPPNARGLPLSVDAFGVPAVPAAVNGVRGTFELDVRAPTSMLFTPFVRSLGLSVSQMSKRRVESIAFAGYEKSDTLVWISNASDGKFAAAAPLGLLGNDVLGAYVITIDYSRRMVYALCGACR